MTQSPNIGLPYLAGDQAQKHVTVNEALARLDAVVQLAVESRSAGSVPAAPSAGERHIVPAGASGAWAGWDGDLAVWDGVAWVRVQPSDGWLAWVLDEAVAVVRSGGAWVSFSAALGLIARAASVDVAVGQLGSALGLSVIEEELSCSGASVTSTVVIPNRAIVLGVSTRTVSAITGASSYDCGIAGEASKFGGSLGVSAGASNIGVIGPQAFYADTPVVLTANGGNFTGGAVRISIHCLLCQAPV